MSEPVLTSSWCTAWGSFNTPRLWSMVMREDDPEAWRQVAAWGEIAGAVKDQRSLLLKAREALVAAWPPEQNTSSAAFVEELDMLLARMDQARTDADDTATGLANILEALRQAKNDIRPLWEQYKAKSDDLVPAWWDNAEEELDRQARQHMITAEQIVQDNVARLKVPDPYALDPKDPRWEPTDARGDTTAGTGAGVSSSGRGGTVVPVPHDPVPPLPGHDPIVPDGAGSGPGPATGGGLIGGPGLAGVINPPQVTPPPVAPPAPGPVVVPPAGGGGGIVPPGPIVGPGIGGIGGPRGTGTGGGAGPHGTGAGPRGLGGTGGGVTGLGAGGIGGVGRGARPGVLPAAAGQRALPSGAVIGETVAGAGRGGAAGATHAGGAGLGGGAGRGGAARAAAARVSGRQGEPVRPPRPAWLPDEPVGAARTGPGTPATAGGARGGRRSGGDGPPPFDPDNPWEVAVGVDPVIAPAPDNARHDPGPNVIGWRG
ncbi:hypothetical protein [Actinoplanes sp. NPDC049118]|uniref:hypothetical protein n=1 Tax=Actinoplanes sp. NPDC049118 TaxID=3155769 RepID=UPI0033CAEC6F